MTKRTKPDLLIRLPMALNTVVKILRAAPDGSQLRHEGDWYAMYFPRSRCKEELPPEAARTIVDEHEGDRSFIAWRFEVKGRPVPYVRMTQAEVLMAKRGLGSRGRQINRYWDWKTQVGWEAKAAGVKVLPRSVFVGVDCHFQIASPLPDTDNLLKGIVDALQGIAYENDKQVRHIAACMKPVRSVSDQKAVVEVQALDEELP